MASVCDKTVHAIFIEWFTAVGNVCGEEHNHLLAYRAVCRDWKSCIMSSLLVEQKKTRQDISRFLRYDSKIYDENFYPRMLRRAKLAKCLDEYRKIKIPKLVVFESDDDDFEEIQMVTEIAMPLHIRLFYHEYFQNPNMGIQIYKPKFLQALCSGQCSALRNHLISDISICDTVLLVPICYVRDYYDDDVLKIHTLCYVNAIGSNAEEQLPLSNERYAVTSMELKAKPGERVKHYEKLCIMASDVTRSADNVLEELQSLPNALVSLDEKICHVKYK
jgi:hypothetical protein